LIKFQAVIVYVQYDLINEVPSVFCMVQML